MGLTSRVGEERQARIQNVQEMNREGKMSVADIARQFGRSKSQIQRYLKYEVKNPPDLLENEDLIELADNVVQIMQDGRIRTDSDIALRLNTETDGRGNVKQLSSKVKEKDLSRVILYLLRTGRLKSHGIKGRVYQLAGRK